jgi:hypothetical protein
LSGHLVLASAFAVPAIIHLVQAIRRHERWDERINWKRLTQAYLAFSALLAAFAFLNVVMAGALVEPARQADLGPAADTPDIYFILLDGYARADTLAGMGFDNTPFVSALESRGFDVSDASHSNYTKTWVTLSTMFDLRHITDEERLAGASMATGRQERELARNVRQSAGLHILRGAGYEISSTASSFSELTLPADELLAPGHVSSFELALLSRTLLARIPALGEWAMDEHVSRVQDEASSLAEQAGPRERPRFVWAHLMSPHPPLVLGDVAPICWPGCSFYAPNPRKIGITAEEFEASYSSQTAVLNGLVLDAIDGILEKYDRPPVIVVFSDHGSRYLESDEAEHFANFFAALTPGHDHLFPDDQAASATLAMLLNAYLDAGVDVPDPDQMWWSPTDAPFPMTRWSGEPASAFPDHALRDSALW